MAPFVLKFKGNKSFSPFSNLTDGDALTRTWKVCTKVAAHLEQGQRLENLSWRLWHLHNLMVDSDADSNAKARREFKKLSRHTGERLDRDKNRDISDLQAPKFTAERLRQRAEEKERCRLASEKTAHALRGRGIRGMQYTFALKPPAATTTTTTVTARKPATSGSGARPRRATDAPKADAAVDAAGAPTSRPRSATTTQAISVVSASDIELPPYDPNDADVDTEHDEDLDMDPTLGEAANSAPQGISDADMLNLMEDSEGSLLRFETLFGGFGPNQLLVNPHAPSFTQPALSYGEPDGSVNGAEGDLSVGRPTFEIPLEELLSADENKDKREEHWSSTDTAANTDVEASGKPAMSRSNTNASTNSARYNTSAMGVIGMKPDADSVPLTHAYAHAGGYENTSAAGTPTSTATGFNWGGSGSPPLMPAQSAPTSPAFALRPVRYNQQETAYPDGIATFNAENYDFAPSAPTGVPPLSLPMSSYSTTPASTTPTTNGKRGAGNNSAGHSRAHSTGNLGGFKHPATININTSTTSAANSKTSTPTSSPTSRNNSANANTGPSATPPPTRARSGSNALPLHGNTAPGGVKSECANCGANSTPLWRRGLNDELNCNACGLYCKLHKRPRPKTLRNSGGEGGTRNPGWHAPRGGNGDTETMGEPVSCYNCHTTATPLWRKDEEGRTLCNACGLYLKLHGERRPSSMKSDVIRKRSRHDARRPGTGNGSSSATPSASPGASRRASPTATSPTVNQDPNSFSTNSEQHMPYYGPYDYSHASSSGMMGADEQTYPMNYAPSPSLMFSQSVGYSGQVGYNTQPYYGPFLPNMMDTSGESPNDGTGQMSANSTGHSNGMTLSPSHTGTSSGGGHPPAAKRRRMSTADTLASTSSSERSDGTPSFLDDLANPNVPDPSRASPSATFVPNNYQYTSFSPSLTYPNLPGNDTNGNNLSYFHPPMVLPWLHDGVPLTNVGAKPEPVDEPMNASELSMS